MPFFILALRKVEFNRRKYYINAETLRFERVKMSLARKLKLSLVMGLGIMAVAVLLRFGFERYYSTPRQIIYQKENATLRSEYQAMNSSLQEVESQLSDLRNRDDRFYRAILGLDPVPSSIREAGTGGAIRHAQLRGLHESGVVLDVANRIDKISSKVQVQSLSLENVYKEAVINQHFLAAKPSINPISPADPYWLTSTFGYRIDPFTRRRAAHHGIDLAGPFGLDIHCTGEGTVITARKSRYGYGNEVVVDHGYGYTSRYAHLQTIHVKVGQKLKRGEIVGTLGSTGRSTGPHLHYEIRKNGRPVNPMFFFYENLSSGEYATLAMRANQPQGVHNSYTMSQK